MRTSIRRLVAGALVMLGGAASAQVPFVGRTTPIPTATAGDVAIVWAPGGGQSPLIAACDPLQNGLYVYATDGGLVQLLPYGPVGGVDVRAERSPDGGVATLVVAAAFVSQALAFSVPGDGGLLDVTGGSIPAPTAAAVSLHRWPDGGLEALVDNSAGSVRRITLGRSDAGTIVGTQRDVITLPSPPASLLVDDRSGTLYASLPLEGLYAVDLTTGAGQVIAPLDGGRFGAMLGGAALYPLHDGGGLMLTTVPSLDEVVVHALSGARSATYVTRFSVESGAEVVRAPRYVDVVPNRLRGFDAGLFVIQDTVAANYKLVPWELLAAFTPVPLPVEVPEDWAGLDADGGASDGGPDDAGADDAGPGDAGALDGGARDGGSTVVVGGGGGPVARPVECSGCCCRAVDAAVAVPGLVVLWVLGVSRRRRVGAA